MVPVRSMLLAVPSPAEGRMPPRWEAYRPQTSLSSSTCSGGGGGSGGSSSRSGGGSGEYI